jgi:hypothetical protein
MAIRFASSVFFALVSLALVGACNGQGEGDPCDTRNGNNDCQNGYVCTTMTAANFMGPRCCPGNPALATQAACRAGAGAVTPVDAGPIDAAIDASETDASAIDAAAVDGSVADGATTDGAVE